MPAAVTYTTVLGQVLMENRGGIVTEFVPDPLGSVVKHKDSTGAYVHSAEYWPYGEIQTSTGNLPGPFAFCGTWGYYRDNASQTYVRARYYKPVQGRWMTVDPLWPIYGAFSYTDNSPLIWVDPAGLQKQSIWPKFEGGGGTCAILQKPCSDILNLKNLDKNARDLINCLWQAGKNSDAIQKCWDKHRDKIAKESRDKLLHYLACVVSSGTMSHTDSLHLDPCRPIPPDTVTRGQCCYQAYLRCLFACKPKDKWCALSCNKRFDRCNLDAESGS